MSKAHMKEVRIRVTYAEWKALEGFVPVGGPKRLELLVARIGRLFGDPLYVRHIRVAKSAVYSNSINDAGNKEEDSPWPVA